MQALTIVRSLPALSRVNGTPVSNPPGGFPISHLALHTAEGIRLIPFTEIVRAESDSNYCIIHLSSGERLVASRTLRCLEDILPASQFVRIHKSHLVRATEMRTLRQDEVVLNDGERLPLSRHQRGAVLEHVQSFSARL